MRNKNNMTATQTDDKKVIIVAPDDFKQSIAERALRRALPRCEEAVKLLKDFGIMPTTDILHDCVTMWEEMEEDKDITPTFNGFSEDSKFTKTMTTKAVFYDSTNIDKALTEMLQSKTKGMTPKENREQAEKFHADVTAFKEALIKCFKSSQHDEIKDVVVKYVVVDENGNAKLADDAEERLKYDTAIKVDSSESVASYEAHKAAAVALNKFIDTLINADRLSVVSDIQQLFNVDPNTLTLSPSVINYKLFSEK